MPLPIRGNLFAKINEGFTSGSSRLGDGFVWDMEQSNFCGYPLQEAHHWSSRVWFRASLRALASREVECSEQKEADFVMIYYC